jgi:hypothetical protein
MPILGIISSSILKLIQSIAVSHSTTPFITAYPWSDTTGFGTKISNPASLPASTSHDAKFNSTGTLLGVAHNSGGSADTNWSSIYPWSNATGFGTKYTTPTNPQQVYGTYSISFNSDSTAVAFVGNNQTLSPFVYAFSGSGFGSRYSLPPKPSNQNFSVGTFNFNPAGSALVYSYLTLGSGTGVVGYPFNTGSGIGTKYTDPVGWGSGNNSRGNNFSPDGATVVLSNNSSPFILAYPFNASTGFGTKYANPASLPPDAGYKTSFNPAGTVVALAHNTSPYITTYAWSSGFGSKYANPATLPTGNGLDVGFSKTGNSIAVAHDSSPYVTAYPWSAGFGTKFANPATLPTGNGQGISFA